MDYNTRSSLIGALADSFTDNKSLKIDTSNYIESTGTMQCGALGLDVGTLTKTKNVIEQHEREFSKKKDDPMAPQYLMHLKVAKKCVEEIISQVQKANK